MAEGPPLAPGDRIGILGGGQLGRMIAVAAAELGLGVHVYCPDPDSPAFDVAAAATVGLYEDREALAAFADTVAVVTYEFENVPRETVEALAPRVAIRPSPRALEIAQDRVAEKTFLADLGVPVAPFRAVDDAADLADALAALGTPAILKTRRFGYDGKGQVRIDDAARAAEAFEAIRHAPAILEGAVPFLFETSLLLAVGADGTAAAYDMPANEHRDGILKWSRVPSAVAPETAAAALDHGRRIAAALDYVGVFAVEWFVVADATRPGGQALVANEIAPRVHNSGHWTQDAAATSQFEQHVRAIAGWPLGSPERIAAATMENLIGAEIDGWRGVLAEPGARLHVYGKRSVRPGRKMGHVNRLRPNGR